MAEYIDKEPFLDKLLYMGYFDDNDEIKEVADSFTTTDVVERFKIDNAIEEIEDLNLSWVASHYEDRFYGFQQEVLEILKKI